MRRRDFIKAIAIATWPLAAHAQQPRTRVIGVLWPGTTPPTSPRMESFRQGLREAGMIEGHDFLIELRYAKEGLQQLPELVAELVRMKVDVISPAGDFALRIAQQGTSKIPIVANSDDMLGTGLVPSLARPGGNTTGLTILSPELSAKRLQLLRDLMPGLSRVASLWDPETGASQVTQTENAAQSMHVKLQVLEVRRSEDLVVAFETARRAAAEAIDVFSSPFLASLYREIIDLARGIGFRRSISGRSMPRLVGSSHMGRALLACGGRPARSLPRSCGVQTLPNCRLSSRPNSSWSSISRLPKRWV